MNGFEQHSRYQEPVPVKKSNKFKSIMSTVMAGVVGSAITLAAVNFTEADAGNQLQPQTESATDSNSNIVTTPTSTKSSGSIADIIETSSKSIVGITNIQSQSSPFSQSQGNVESGSGSGVIFKKEANMPSSSQTTMSLKVLQRLRSPSTMERKLMQKSSGQTH